MTMRSSVTRVMLAVASIFVALLAVGSHANHVTAKPPADKSAGTREISPNTRDRKLPVKLGNGKDLPPKAKGGDLRPPQIGDQRVMLALDDQEGSYYFKSFTLRGSNKSAEVWVSEDLNFPGGDCRNGDRRSATLRLAICWANLVPTFGPPIRLGLASPQSAQA